jgi:hypothetical protein
VEKEQKMRKLRDDLTELVAMRLHAYDARVRGVPPFESVTKGWEKRYRGMSNSELPRNYVGMNFFRENVDEFVAMIMTVVSKEFERRYVEGKKVEKQRIANIMGLGELK